MTKPKSQLIAVSRSNQPDITNTGGGTLLILLAQSLPATYDYKSLLVAAAPTVSMLLIYLWKTITKEFSSFKNEKKTKKRKIKVTQEMDQFMANPHISNVAKETLQEIREQFHLAFIQEQIRQLNVLMKSE